MEQQFELVDAAYCFLARHRATLSVRNVVQMTQSLRAGAVSAADLRRMAQLAPELLTLHTAQQKQLQHRDDVFRPRELTPDDLELLAFPLHPQVSARASQKRKKLFAAALKASASSEETSPLLRPPVEAEAASKSPVKPPAEAETSAASPWVAMLQSLDIYKNQLVHVETRAARAASHEPLASLSLPPQVESALDRLGIRQLYLHQFEAIEATLRGNNVVLSTSTASGKSMAFNVPMLANLVSEPASTFFYLFPTKALAQDQLKSLRRMLQACGLPERLAATFDGDTPMKSRSMVIRDAQIFLTNPDIMHLTILAKHTQWKTVLANLKLLVIDEAHMYRGVFGSHVANVFRRLFRLCALYGSNPRVICCSATVRNPEAHFRMLIPRLPPKTEGAEGGDPSQVNERPANFDFYYERPLRVITQDGAPTGEKIFCVWNPKAHKNDHHDQDYSSNHVLVADQPTSKRKRKRDTDNKSITSPRAAASDKETTVADEDQKEPKSNSSSSIYQSAVIFSRLVAEQIHTIMFCKGRKLSELVLMGVHSVLKDNEKTKHLVKRVHTYRGGYTVEDRRRIEGRLFQGDLLGVIATNALELGIDVGELDCTMHLGLPSSISSLWQQAGRAGRKHTQQSLAVIVCFDSPLDQYFARHSSELFRLEPEAVTLNGNNTKIVAPHLLCAAHEYPLYDTRSGLAYVDTFILGHQTESSVAPLLRELAERQQVVARTQGDGGGFRLHSCALKSFRAINLRSISEINYQVVTDDSEQLVLDQIPGELVFFQVYPTAVYLHQAQEYIVTRLDTDQKVAFARRCPQPLTYFTTPRDYTDVEVVKVQRRRKVQPLLLGDKDPNPDEAGYVCEGDVSITTSVFGSTLMEKRTMRVIHSNEFTLPPMQSFGHAMWLELPHTLRQSVEAASFVWSGALHGVGHVLMAVIPLYVLCDAGDINTEHYNPFERRIRPNRVTIYERREGGSGLVEEIVRCLPAIVQRAWTLASECGCLSGCPSCVHSAQCTEYNKVLDKRGSLMVLEYLTRACRQETEIKHE